MSKKLISVAVFASLAYSAAAQTFSISGAISPASTGSGTTVTLTSGAPVIIQGAHGSASGGSTSAQAPFGSGSGSADTIVVFVRYGGTTATIPTVTDNQAGGSNSYTPVFSNPTQWGVAPNATDRFAQVFVAKNIPGGTKLTITVNFSAASTRAIYIAALEYSGVDSVNPVNATAFGTGNSGINGAPTTNALTTTVTNTKLVATSWDSNESYTSTGNGQGFTTQAAAADPSITGGSGWANLTEDETAASPGSWMATASSSPTVDDWAIQLIALAPIATQTVTADSNGNFTFANLKKGSYVVTPTKTFFGFTPTNQSVTVNGANVTGVNFTEASTVFSISGSITPGSTGSGTTVTLAGGAPTLVQSAPGSNHTGSSSGQVSFGSPSTGGDTIVLFLRFGGLGVQASSVTDNQGSNTYASVIGPTQWGVSPDSTDRWAQVFVAKNITGGSKLTITVTLNGSSTHDIYMAALEYSGVDPVNPVNATAQGTGAVRVNGAPITSNLTTTVPNAKLVATSWDSEESYTASGNGTGYTTDAQAGITSLAGGTGWPNLTEDSTATTPETTQATASSSPAVVDWAIQVVALAPAGTQTATADTSGDYIFNTIPNGTYVVVPSKPSSTFNPTSQSVTVNNNNVAEVNFAITASTGTVSGTVKSSSGTAIAGATVSYSGGSTTTASDGSYTLLNVPVGTVSVTSSATGYVSSTQSVAVTANTTSTQNFTLTAAVGTISGTVTSSSGTAISGATVSYSGGSTTTASNGSYTLSNVPVGTISVTASAAGYQTSTQSVTVAANTTTNQNFALSANVGTISGTVKSSNGSAIAGATVGYNGGSVSTATDGSYTLSNVPAGTVNVTASATGYVSSTQSVTVTAGTTIPLNFTLTLNAGTISGTVTNSSGTAISGATVSYNGGSTTTASNGTYILSSVPAGTVSITASATGYVSSTQSATVTAGTITTLNFTLSTSVGTVSGTVKNSAGTAISGATVSYSGGSTTSASNGTYILSSVPAGTVSITASANGYVSSTQTVAVTANTTSTQNFTLTAAVGTISGTVTNSSGTAISGATVSYSGGSTTAASNGTYTLSNVPVGTVNVTASATGYQNFTQSVTVTANNTTTQNFTLLVAVGTVSGTVTTSSGTAISGATVSYTGGSTTTGANGTYTLSNVPVGTVSVTANATGYLSSTQNVTVSAGTTATQNFTLSIAVTTGTISGTVTNSSATPISGATVSYTGGSTATSSTGAYILSNVPAGTVSVTASATGYVSSTQSVTVTAGTTTSQNFSLASSVGPPFSIQGAISPASTGTGSLVALNGPVPVLVQTARGSNPTGNSSATVTFGAASGAGDAIVVFVRYGGTSTAGNSTTITDNQNTYTSVIATQWGVNPSDRWAQAFVAKNITGGTQLAITAHFAAGSTHDIYLVALEYSGVDPVNPVNATAFGKGSGSSPSTAGLSTTVGDTKLVATGWDANESYISTSNGSGFTTNTSAGINSMSGGSGWANLTEDSTAATAGTWNATTTSARAVTDWAIQLVALTPVSLQTTTADSTGSYTFLNLNGGTYTITPSKSGHTFTPTSQAVTINNSNISGVNFTIQ